MATRIGVDVGGTFTDLIFYEDESGEVLVAKEPTTPAGPEQGVVAAVDAAVSPDQVRRSEYFLVSSQKGLPAADTGSGDDAYSRFVAEHVRPAAPE